MNKIRKFITYVLVVVLLITSTGVPSIPVKAADTHVSKSNVIANSNQIYIHNKETKQVYVVGQGTNAYRQEQNLSMNTPSAYGDILVRKMVNTTNPLFFHDDVVIASDDVITTESMQQGYDSGLPFLFGNNITDSTLPLYEPEMWGAGYYIPGSSKGRYQATVSTNTPVRYFGATSDNVPTDAWTGVLQSIKVVNGKLWERYETLGNPAARVISPEYKELEEYPILSEGVILTEDDAVALGGTSNLGNFVLLADGTINKIVLRTQDTAELKYRYYLQGASMCDKHVPSTTHPMTSLEYSGTVKFKTIVEDYLLSEDDLLYQITRNESGNLRVVGPLSPTPLKTISKWHDHLLALDYTGNIWALGDNNFGECGNGTQVPIETLTQITYGTEFESVGAGNNISCAVDTLGNVYTWGNNEEGYLGFVGWHLNEVITNVLTPQFLFNINEVTDYDSTSFVVTKEPTVSENGILEATCKRTGAVREIPLRSKESAEIVVADKPIPNTSVIGDNTEDGKVVYRDISGNTVSENEITYSVAFFNTIPGSDNNWDFIDLADGLGDDKKESFTQILNYSEELKLPEQGSLDGEYTIRIKGTDIIKKYTVSTNHYMDKNGVIYTPGQVVSKLTKVEGEAFYLKVVYDRVFDSMPTQVSYNGVSREVASYNYYADDIAIKKGVTLKYKEAMTKHPEVLAVPIFTVDPDRVIKDLKTFPRPVSKMLKRIHFSESTEDVFYNISNMESYIRSYFPVSTNPTLDDLTYQTVKQTLYVREYANPFSDTFSTQTYANATVNTVYRNCNLYGVTRVTIWGKDANGVTKAIRCVLMLAPPPELLSGEHRILSKDFDYSNTYAYIDIMDVEDFPEYTLIDTLNNTESHASTLNGLPRYIKQGDLILVDWTFDRAGRRSIYKWDGKEVPVSSPDYKYNSPAFSLDDIPQSTIYSQWVPYRETGDVKFYPVDTVTENTVFSSEDVIILGNVENTTLSKLFGKSNTITQTLMKSTDEELKKLLDKFSKSSRELNLKQEISKKDFVYTEDKILVSDGWSSVNLGGEVYKKQESLNSVEVPNPEYVELDIPEEGSVLEPFPNTAAELYQSWYEDDYYVIKATSEYKRDDLMDKLYRKIAYSNLPTYDATFLNLPVDSIYDTGYAFATSMSDPIQKIYLHKYTEFSKSDIWYTDFADTTKILNHLVDINGNPITIPIGSGMCFTHIDRYYNTDIYTNPVLTTRDVKTWLETKSYNAQVNPFNYNDWSFHQGAQIGDRKPTPFVGTNASDEYVDVYYEKRLNYWDEDYSHFALVSADGYEFRWVDTFMRKSYVANPYDYVYKDVVQVDDKPLNNDQLFNAIRYGDNKIASELDALPLGTLYELPYIWYLQPGDVPQKIFIKQTWNDGTTVGSPFDDFSYTRWEGLFFTEDGTEITADYYQDTDGNWHDYEYYKVNESGNTILPTVRGDICVKDDKVYVDAGGTAVDITSLSYNSTTTYGEALTQCEDIFQVDLLDVKTIAKTVSGDAILLNESNEPSVHTSTGLNSLYRNQLSQYANGYLKDSDLLETAILYAIVDGQDLIEMLKSETFYIIKFPSERDMKIARSYIKEYIVSKVTKSIIGDYELKLDALSLRLDEGADTAYEYRDVTVSADALDIPAFSEWHLKYDKDSSTPQEYDNFICSQTDRAEWDYSKRSRVFKDVVLPIIEDDMSQTLHISVDSYQTVPGAPTKPRVFVNTRDGIRTEITKKAGVLINNTSNPVQSEPVDGKNVKYATYMNGGLNILTEDSTWYSSSLNELVDNSYKTIEDDYFLNPVDIPVKVKALYNTEDQYSYTGRVHYFIDVDGNLWGNRRAHDGVHFENHLRTYTQMTKGIKFEKFGITRYPNELLLIDNFGNIWTGHHFDANNRTYTRGFFSKFSSYLNSGVTTYDDEGNPIGVNNNSFILRRVTQDVKFVDVKSKSYMSDCSLYALDSAGNIYVQGYYSKWLGQFYGGADTAPSQPWYYANNNLFKNQNALQFTRIDKIYPRLQGVKWSKIINSDKYLMFLDNKGRLWEQMDALVGYQITETNVRDASENYIITTDGILHAKKLQGKNAATKLDNNLFGDLRFKYLSETGETATLTDGSLVFLPSVTFENAGYYSVSNGYYSVFYDNLYRDMYTAGYDSWANGSYSTDANGFYSINGNKEGGHLNPGFYGYVARQMSFGTGYRDYITTTDKAPTLLNNVKTIGVTYLNDLQNTNYDVAIDFNDLFYIDGIPFDKGDYIEIESEYGTMIHKIVGAEMKTIGMYSEMLSENNVPVTKEIDGVEITTNQLKIDRVTSDMDQAIMYSKSVYTAEPNPYYSRRITLDVVEIESLEAEYIGDDVIVGTEIPTSDIELTARYEDGHEINLLYSELTDAPQTMSIQSLGANMFTFEYEEVADDVVINGIAPPPGLSVVSVSGNIPDSTFVGTDFDETKAEIEVTYNDGTVQSISYNDLDIPIADQEVTNVGTNTYPIVVNSVSGNLTVQGYYYDSISANYVGPAIVAPDSYSKSDVEVSLSYTPNNVGAVTRVLNDSEWLASSLNIPSVGWHTFTATLVDDVSYTADYSILGIKQPQSLTATYTGIPLLKGTTYSKDDVQVDVVYTDATTETLSSNSWIASSLIVTDVGVNTYSASYGTLSANYVITGFNNMNHITAQYTGQPVSVGQDYSKDDVLVTLFYDNNETETISSNGWSASGITITATGNNTFTATYLSMTADYTVPGLRVPVSITAVYDGPDIVLGRQYSKDDVDVTVTYNDTTQELLSSSAWTPSSLVVTNVSSNSFTATYGSLTTQYTVNGYNNVESISANYVGEPVLVGTNHNKGDVTVVAVYSNGATTPISGNDWTASSLLVTRRGANSFTATYQTFSDTYSVPGEIEIKGLSAKYNGPQIHVGSDYAKADVTVTATFTDSSTRVLSASEWVASGVRVDRVGTNTYTATYRGQRATYDVMGFQNVIQKIPNIVTKALKTGDNSIVVISLLLLGLLLIITSLRKKRI